MYEVTHKLEGYDLIGSIRSSVLENQELLKRIFERIEHMSAQLTRLQADVTNANSVAESAVTLLKGIATQIRAADASDEDGAVSALADALEKSTSDLQGALTANTPVTPAVATATSGTVSVPAPAAPADPNVPAVTPVTDNVVDTDGTPAPNPVTPVAPDGTITAPVIAPVADPATGQTSTATV